MPPQHTAFSPGFLCSARAQVIWFKASVPTVNTYQPEVLQYHGFQCMNTIRQARQAGRPAAEGSGICKLLLCCPLGPVCGDTAAPPHLCLEMGEKQSGSDQSTNDSSQYIASINCISLLLLTACISMNLLLFGLVRLWCTPLYLLWFKLKGNQVSSKMTAHSMGAERKTICLHECR